MARKQNPRNLISINVWTRCVRVQSAKPLHQAATGCAISYLLESKVAQYLIQKYHQPSQMLIASPHILLALLTLFTLLTLLKLLKLSKVRVHWASVDKIPKSTCGANKSCIVKHHLRWFMVFYQICTTANTEKEKRRWMCYTLIVLNLERATMNEFPQEWVLDVPDRGEAFTWD